MTGNVDFTSLLYKLEDIFLDAQVNQVLSQHPNQANGDDFQKEVLHCSAWNLWHF